MQRTGTIFMLKFTISVRTSVPYSVVQEAADAGIEMVG